MRLPIVIREETNGLRKFKTFWQGEIVNSAIFKGKFYRSIQTFSEYKRFVCYRLAVQMSKQYEVMITVASNAGEDRQGQTYTIWANKWDYLLTKPDLFMEDQNYHEDLTES